MIVLSVEVGEEVSELPDHGDGRWLAIDATRAPSLRADVALHMDHTVFGIEARFAQSSFRGFADSKSGAHSAEIGAGSHGGRIGARTEREQEGAHDEGLPRARFSRDYRHAARELEGRLFDDPEVLDL